MMRHFKIALLLFCLLLSPPLTVRAEIPDTVFAPYVDVTLWPPPSLHTIYQDTGQKYFTLAFILQGTECTPTWAGLPALDLNFFQTQISELRAVGGDVIISFGGANGTELAMGCTDEARLLAAYQEVIDRYTLEWVDFDIEGWAVSDQPSIDLRNRVIKQLQTNNPDLKVAFCLPVLPQGLTREGLYVLQSAKDAGVRIDVVNVMAMDYGDGPAPNPEGQMGRYAIDAAQNTHDQVVNMGIDTTIGITPMIGQNDVMSERFYQQDASQLLAWAQATPWVSMLSMWSSGRDNGGCPGLVRPSCSGIVQNNYDFTNIFKAYTTGGSNGNHWPTVAISSPTHMQQFDINPDIIITATATDSDGTITQVEFFNGDHSLGIDSSSPYSIVWQNVPGGMQDILAMATDNDGATARSSQIKILVGPNICLGAPWDSSAIYWGGDEVSHNNKEWKAGWWTQGDEPGTGSDPKVWKFQSDCNSTPPQNLPPTVSISNPTDGSSYSKGDAITLTANAADSDGTISQVEFFAGTQSLGTVSTSPYSIIWQNVLSGSHQLTARATDNDGAQSTSTPVIITVSSGTGAFFPGLLFLLIQ